MHKDEELIIPKHFFLQENLPDHLVWFSRLFSVCRIIFKRYSKGAGPYVCVVHIGMAILGYFIMKKLIWDLIDEVYDEGTSLLFRNRNQEVRVNLKDIKNVSYSTMTNPPRVTLSIRHKTALGDELTFSPPACWVPFKKNEDIERLIDRIDEAREVR